MTEQAVPLKEFLDTNQYTSNGILRYEFVFGRGFVSAGGRTTTEHCVSLMKPQAGQRILDVGCGIGGSAFYIAKNFGATVQGIDLASNMISIGQQRTAAEDEEIQKMVNFELADAMEKDFEDGSFDAIYSRDTILHIKDKKGLFDRFFRWLKPGGVVVISDYCCGPEPWTDSFQAYVAQRGYHLLTPPAYGSVLESAGFNPVAANDETDMFVTTLESEMEVTKTRKDEFLKEFTEQDYGAIMDGWTAKIKRCSRDEAGGGVRNQRWGVFVAHKPLEPVTPTA